MTTWREGGVFDEACGPGDVVLVKSIFAVGAPCACGFEETCRAGSRMRKCETAFSMGRMHPKDVASAIGAKFAERDIPFTFSKYRTGSAAWLKMKGSKSVLGW